MELVWWVVGVVLVLVFGVWLLVPPRTDQAQSEVNPPTERHWHWSGRSALIAFVVLSVLLLAIVAVAVVLGRYETLACGSANEPEWLVLVFPLPFVALVLVPVSILRIWECAGKHDFAYLLWIVVLAGSVIPLLLLIKTNPFCPS